MIQLTQAGMRFGPKVLFEGADWLITPQDRVGLVGANGTGKTTLMKVLAGMEHLDSGSVSRMKGVRIGYLPQDGLALRGRTVFNECLSVFSGVREMEREFEDLSRQLAELEPGAPEYNAAADRFHRLESELSARDAYTIEAQAGVVLTGLAFPKDDWDRLTEEFSGGWQMRIALAKLLLQKPELLLLDEPTNHLDLEARNWLEDYLKSYPHAFVLISHDRYFLDVSVEKMVEIWNRALHFYPGNYEKYLQQRHERRAHLEAQQRNQQERIHQLEVFINRFRYKATKARQVQSRVKELEKIDRIEIPDEEQTIHFSFSQPKASGRIVAEFKGVAKSYGAKGVLSEVDFLIERGDKIALVGRNGAGKSTLIKLLAGLEPLTRGEYRLGHNVLPDYFAQDQYKELDGDAVLLDDLATAGQRMTITELRTLLGCFLFSDDDAFKSIGVLSGGERNRYALARMLVSPSNFLLLDEPTNHLDLRAKDVLLEALHEYSGTVVFVSHDRYFIDGLANRVFEIGGGAVRTYAGDYEEYFRSKEREKSASPAAPAGTVNGGDSETPAHAAEQSETETVRSKRVNPIKLRQLEERASEIEEEVAKVEAEIAELETALASFVNAEQTIQQNNLLIQRRADLNALMTEWEETSQALEEAR